MAGKKRRILLVEDSDADADLVRLRLTSSDVVHAQTLGDALCKLDSEKFDAVVADLCLPDSDPDETVSRLRRRSSGAPIIAYSGVEREVPDAAAFYVKDDMSGLKSLIDSHSSRGNGSRYITLGSVAIAISLLGGFVGFVVKGEDRMRAIAAEAVKSHDSKGIHVGVQRSIDNAIKAHEEKLLKKAHPGIEDKFVTHKQYTETLAKIAKQLQRIELHQEQIKKDLRALKRRR